MKFELYRILYESNDRVILCVQLHNVDLFDKNGVIHTYKCLLLSNIPNREYRICKIGHFRIEFLEKL